MLIQVNKNIVTTGQDEKESWEKNVIIFGADMSLSVHVDNYGKDILILGEEPTQGLDATTSTADVKYPINFASSGRVCTKSTLNRSNSFLFVNATKTYQFKAKDSTKRLYTVFR